MSNIHFSIRILNKPLVIWWSTWMAGAADRASVKQIMHMSSASCFRQPVFLSQPCKQGKHNSSFFTPPQGWPHAWVLLQASFAYSYTHTNSDQVANAVALLHLTETLAWKTAFIVFWEVLRFLPDSLGLSTHSPLQTTRCHSWCHRSGRHLNCLKQVYLKNKSWSLTAMRVN